MGDRCSTEIGKPGRIDWVKCPVCDEPDMRKLTTAEGFSLIFCVNHGCRSNGGTMDYRGAAQRPVDCGLADLIAAKMRGPAFANWKTEYNEVGLLPVIKVGPTAVSDWRVVLMSGREISLRDEEWKSAALPAQPVQGGKGEVDTEEATYDRANTVPVAWIAFAGNGNIRLWTSDAGRAKEEKEDGLDLRAFTLAELVALAARSGDVAYGAWQPIETAPKDGTEVLVWCAEGLDLAHYSEGEADGPDSMGHDPGWWGIRQPIDPGRHMGNPEYFREAENQPWAWMPKPEPAYDDEGEPLFSKASSVPSTGGGPAA